RAAYSPYQWRLVPAPLTANATTPPHTSADCSAGLSDGASGHTDTTNSCPTRPAAEPDLRGHAGWVKRRDRHCRRRCVDDEQGERDSEWSFQVRHLTILQRYPCRVRLGSRSDEWPMNRTARRS